MHMRKQLSMVLAVVSSVLLIERTAQPQSAFFQAVTNLTPAAYWPLQETAQPPSADVETNYGSFGAAGNAYYSSTNIFKGRPGPMTGDTTDAVVFSTPTTTGSFLAVPQTYPGVALPAGPFTVEAWVQPTNYGGNAAIMGQAGPNPGGLNGGTNMGGWVLSQNYLAYSDASSGTNHMFSFHVYNGSGGGNGAPHGGAEADAYISYLTNGSWYHLVGVFDGVNCQLYVNTATNYTTNQIPMVGSYYQDTWDPLTIGCGRGVNANLYSGGLDEVAIYTYALTATQVTNHFNATNSGALYHSTILADNPYMYWRMNNPGYTASPAISAFPVATNFGAVANLNGLYLSGTTPGLAGPPHAGLGLPSYGCAFNGLGTDATNGISTGVIITNLAPTLNLLSNNITVMFWFKGNPEDSRFQTMLGHSDNSWRASLNQNGKVQFNAGEGGELTSSGVFNDGQWHLAAGVYLNAGTIASGEDFLYVDGVLNASGLVTGAAAGSATNVLLGGAPDYYPSGNGASYRNRFFAGSLAHVAYFTNALTAAQIQSVYWAAQPPPAVQLQPGVSVTNNASATNVWVVAASGFTNLIYQWYYNGTASYSGATALTDATLGSGTVITGSATPTFAAANLHSSDTGYYFFVVTNSVGSATSILSQLTVLTSPVVTAQSPSGAFTLANCMSTVASVTVAGGIPVTYQWVTNGVPDMSAGNGPTYAISDVQLVQSGETYQCLITNAYGSTASSIATLTVTALPGGVPPSPYAANILALKPALYYPMQETTQPPANDIENNIGSLGAAGNAVYSSVNAAKGAGGVTGDGDTAVNFSTVQNSGNGRFLAVPLGNPGVVLPAGPFTVEAWVNPSSYGRGGIVAQSGPIGSGGLNGSANSAGWSLTENDIPSLNSSSVGWSFHVYNANGSTGTSGGAEATIITQYNLNQWYHIVGVFDGVNCTLYINGTSIAAMAAANPTTTTLLAQPMTGTQARDTWDPITIGCARGLNANDFNGEIDEVALYTQALTQGQVQAHYAAVSGASYSTTVLGDNPYMYWRMDAPTYTAPSQSSYPTINNYGLVANVNTVNGTLPSLYGPASQPAVPGPQFPGMSDPLSGNNNSYAALINGIGGANGGTANVSINGVSIADGLPIDIGTNAVLNPTTITAAGNSVALWFKANPNDNRFQNMVGHSDNGWRVALDGTGHVNFKAGNNGTQITSGRIYADGNWHLTVATWSTAGWAVYVDGVQDGSAGASNAQTGCTNDVILGGDTMYLNSGNGTYASNPSSGTAYAQRIFNGSLTHFAYFTNALSAAQIQTLYNVASVPPSILVQPATGRVNPAPLYLFFGTTAAGSAPLSYQWYFNSNSNYAGAIKLANDGVKYALVNTLQMTVSNLVDSDSGYYYVVVTNNSGSVTSTLASLVINDKPIISSALPTNALTLYQGQTRALSVTVNSDVGVFYQWSTNGVADPNGFNPTYVLGPAQTAWSGETVRCIVSNAYGNATNNVALTVLPLPAIPVALTNTPFGSNILALHPTAYWPMHEIEAPLPGSQRDIETNYGTLGQVANAYFGDWKLNNGAPSNSVIIHQSPGALSGSQTNPSAYFSGSGGSYAVIPRTSPLTTIKAPFTLEAWVKPLNNSFGIILGCGNLTTNRGPAANNAFGGFDWLWAGTANTFSITMRSGPTNPIWGAVNAVSTEPKTTANYYPGQWYHLVTTFDGTNIAYYINGAQDSLQNSAAATMAPDTWHPLTIGGGRWTGGINNQFNGYIDELAVYTNLLNPSDISLHFADGSNPAADYAHDVLTNNPILYYRMDSLPYTEPPLSAWPVLTNYGSVGVQGVYRPSVTPASVAGPSGGSIPVAGLSANTAFQCDGISAFADAGTDLAFNPTGKTPFTVAAWEKSNPADAADRGWQTFVGHSDSGWRMVIDANIAGGTNGGLGNLNFNAGPGGGVDIGNTNNGSTTVQNLVKAYINDGNWHYVVGTFDGSNSVGYVDGVLVETNLNNAANITGTAVDVFLGGYPSGTLFSDIPTSTRNEANRILAGNLCEAAFWNGVVLNSNQVSQLYTAAGVPPILGAQPVSATVNQNSAFTNSVSVIGGAGPFSYQWYQNGARRPGLTNATIVLNPVQSTDASPNWYVVVTNNYASVTSIVWSLTVFSAPVFANDIVNTTATLFEGGHANYSVLAFGALPLRYQWYTNSVAAGNATNTSFALNNVQPPNGTIHVYCIASNFVGTATSSTATINVRPVPAASYPQTVLAANPLSFWRLNEPDNGSGNNGVTAIDYWGGNDGIYTNTTLAQTGYNPNEPTETAAYFGTTFQDSDAYGISTNVDFSAPIGGNSSFTIEAWAKGYQQLTDAGVVSKGYGSGGEQFNLDCGSGVTTANPTAHSYRFFVRNASGVVSGVSSSVNPADNLWHYLVGVCDETNGVVIFYIDGLPVGTNAITPGSGILATTRNMIIGSRPSNSTTNHNDSQYVGWVDDVAVFNRALSASEVMNVFNSANIPATVAAQPEDITACQNGTAMFTATVEGTPPVSLQWYDETSGLPIPGATNGTLFVNNVQSGGYYHLLAANGYGTNQSRSALLSIASGGPNITVEPQAQYFALRGSTISIPATVVGTLPMTNQWQISDANAVNWTNLTVNSRISGAQLAVLNMTNIQPTALTIANVQYGDAGVYQLTVTNAAGFAVSTLANLIVGSMPISFNSNGIGWTTNGSSGIAASNVMSMTDPGGAGGNGSIFFQYPQYIAAFKSAFTYQDLDLGGADGVSFCLQNDPRGTTALGGGGGSLGVSGITPSLELELNLYNGNTEIRGFAVKTNGLTGAGGANGNYAPLGSVNLNSGDPIDITVNYIGGLMSMTFTDAVANTSFNTSMIVNLPELVGANTAFVGFTGAFGGTTAHQLISNFSFVSLPTETLSATGTNIVIAWPGSIAGYLLQQSGDLTATNWVNVTNLDTVVNGAHQISVPITSSNLFYRLVLP